MSSTPLFFNNPRSEPTIFIPGFAARPRIILLPKVGGNGFRATEINLSSSSATPATFQFFIGRKLTAAGAVGVGNLSKNGASADTITRTVGDFTAPTGDGWRVGDRCMVHDAQTLANDTAAIVSAVTGQILTTQIGSLAASEAFGTLTALYRIVKKWYVSLPAGAGTPTLPSVSGLDTTQDPGFDPSPDRGLALGPNDYLFGQLSITLATNETVDCVVSGYDY